MITVFAIFIIAVIVLAILALVKPPTAYTCLAIAVLLIGIMEALSHFGMGVIR